MMIFNHKNMVIAAVLMAQCTPFAHASGAAGSLPVIAGLVVNTSENEYEQVAADIRAARHLRAGALISRDDLSAPEPHSARTSERLTEIIGKEARRTIYAGKIIFGDDLQPPTIVRRNDVVAIEFRKKRLVMTADGRALESGGLGESVRVMNSASKIILTAVIIGDSKVAAK